MNVLAIEYSSAQRSVAVVCANALGQPVVSAEAVETGGRAANTFSMVEEALREAGIEREQIECVAVGLGPGSYTGIRSAISFAQGWQLAGGARVAGMPSTKCIVAEACSTGLTGRAGLVIDAQRGEFYVAVYELPAGKNATTGIREIEPLRISGAAEVQALQKAGCQLFGPENLKALPGLRIVPARALTLARLALETNQFVSAETLAPVYLRQTTFVKAPKPRDIS